VEYAKHIQNMKGQIGQNIGEYYQQLIFFTHPGFALHLGEGEEEYVSS
jgi:hypothetical protein